MEKKITHLFVYGTLKKNFPLHNVLINSQYIRKDAIKGFVMYDLGAYPAIAHRPDYSIFVHGEVYLVTPETIAMIDSIEGVPHLYHRIKTATLTGLTVDVYVLPDASFLDQKKIIEDGVWEKNKTLRG